MYKSTNQDMQKHTQTESDNEIDEHKILWSLKTEIRIRKPYIAPNHQRVEKTQNCILLPPPPPTVNEPVNVQYIYVYIYHIKVELFSMINFDALTTNEGYNIMRKRKDRLIAI